MFKRKLFQFEVINIKSSTPPFKQIAVVIFKQDNQSDLILKN